MNRKCNLYPSEDISLFIDGELASEKYPEFEHHLSSCKECRNLIDNYKSLSLSFSGHVGRQAMGGSEGFRLKLNLVNTEFNSQKKSLRHFSGLFGKNLYLKLASIAAVLMIGLFPFDEDLLMDSSGPSAIVNSVDSEYTSVMIIETQEEKHTIIWFTEET